MLVVDILMRREEKELTTKDLFHVYCIVRTRRNFETHMYEGNHYLRLRKHNQPQMRLVLDSSNKDLYLNDFVWVSNSWEFQAGDPRHYSIPRRRGYIPVGKHESSFVLLYLGYQCESYIYFVS